MSSGRGREVLQLLHSHTTRFSDLFPGANSAAEECERQVEQEQQVEKQMETEVQLIASVPQKESDWNTWETALQSKTLQEFLHCASTEVHARLLVLAVQLAANIRHILLHYEYASKSCRSHE